ncbi:Maf family protein [Marichromatium bheemlicum]|uniref:dTTP/UTP pyrophosphatase n=1 Tax=Marichromatium bheemlicum TaxID=365339 RepID=A0ABX1IBW7_9GAMM|nr:nucleoside triphosphate pyrophosphatase [Marichromatium bheemlicum]NKN34406.1 septum formation inhibitor Maf [Marichromatium bheemlicum]
MDDTPPRLHLASRSPRRAELLEQIGVRFTRIDAEVDETPRPGEAPGDYVRRVTRDKGRAGWAQVEGCADALVLAADTAVVVDAEILGKPRDRGHALEMMGLLSGRCHRVLTAVALVGGAGEAVRVCETEVRFRPVSPAEAARYWESGEPRDKAGGYAIQGLGAVFVAAITGSYSAVMGLPLFETAALLAEAGLSPLAPPAPGAG